MPRGRGGSIDLSRGSDAYLQEIMPDSDPDPRRRQTGRSRPRGKTTYEPPNVAEFPSIHHEFPGKIVFVVLSNFHRFLFGISPNVCENFNTKQNEIGDLTILYM